MRSLLPFFLFLSLPLISAGFYGSGDKVIELDESNFSSKVLKGNEIWIVEFYAPWCGHCQSLTPEWKKAAEALDGIIKVGAVDADAHKSLGGTYGIQGFPTIKIFGLDKSSPSSVSTYEGERTAKAIVKYALNQANKIAEQRLGGGKKSSSSSSSSSKKPSSGGSNAGGGATGQVIELTPANFDKTVLESDELWLVEFYAPWCGHCKHLAPEWKKAAAALEGIANIAAVDADQHKELGSRYGVRGFPTIKIFGKNKKSPEDYNGGRTASDIISQVKSLAKSMPPPKPKVIEQLVSQSSLDECTSSTVCVIAVLPHIVDSKAKGRQAYIDTINKASAKFRGQPYHFTWLEAGAQPELESALGIGGFGYPAMAAYIKKSSKPPQYTLLTGAFSVDSITDFLQSRAAPHDVPGGTLPSIQSTTPWDGKDAKIDNDGELDAHKAAQEAAEEDPELAALLKDL